MRLGDDLTNRKCNPCEQILLNGRPLVYDGQDIMHRHCYEKALRAFREAMRLAAIAQAINEYVANRDNL